MLALVCCMSLVCGTVQLKDGEIFEGKVLGESAERIWLQVPSGGIISFDKSRVAHVSGYNPTFVGGPDGTESTVSPTEGLFPPAPVVGGPLSGEAGGGDLSDGGSVRKVVIAWQDRQRGLVREFVLSCPLGFQFQRAPQSGSLIGTLKEARSGAVVRFSATPFDGVSEDAWPEVRKRIAAGLLAERGVPVGTKAGRLFQWQGKRDGRDVGGMTLAFVDHGSLVLVEAFAPQELAAAYREVFLGIMRCLKLTDPRPEASQAGKTSSAEQKGTQKKSPPPSQGNAPAGSRAGQAPQKR